MTQFVLYADPVLFWQLRQWHSAYGADSVSSHHQQRSLTYNNGGFSLDFYFDSPAGTASLVRVCHIEFEGSAWFGYSIKHIVASSSLDEPGVDEK